MPDPVTVTDDLLTSMYDQVRLHLIDVLTNDRNSDDGGDYTYSALEVYRVFQWATQDQFDTCMIEDYLNFYDIDASWMPEGFPLQVTPLCNLAYEGPMGPDDFHPPRALPRGSLTSPPPRTTPPQQPSTTGSPPISPLSRPPRDHRHPANRTTKENAMPPTDSNHPLYPSISRDAPPDLMYVVATMLDTYCDWLNLHEASYEAKYNLSPYSFSPPSWIDNPEDTPTPCGHSVIRAIYETSDHWVLALYTDNGEDDGPSTITGYWNITGRKMILAHLLQEFDTYLQPILTDHEFVNTPDSQSEELTT